MGEKVKEECAREEERRREECERVVGMRGLVSSSFLLNTIATKVSHNSYASVNLNDTVGEPIQQLSRGIQEPSRGIQEPSRGIQEPSRGIQEQPASPPLQEPASPTASPPHYRYTKALCFGIPMSRWDNAFHRH
jgi:hypothetical protein